MARRFYSIGVIALLVSLAWAPTILARGEALVNNTEAVARALRITFSEPVVITGLGDDFDYWSPQLEATQFTLTGGRIAPSWTVWVTWKPDSARIVSSEWLVTGGGVQLDMPIDRDSWTLDPAQTLVAEGAVATVLEQLFLHLVGVDPTTGEILPELAVAWEASADAMSWVFTLRDGVRWSDGEPVTAADVRFALLRTLATGSYYKGLLFDIRNAAAYADGKLEDPADVGIEALDDRHVLISLDRSCSFLPALMAADVTMLLPQHALDRYGGSWMELSNLVTNGPYRLVRWIPGDRLTLEKNQTYYAANDVTIVRVNLWVRDASSAWEEYLAGLLDTTSVPVGLWNTVRRDPALALQLQASAEMPWQNTSWFECWAFSASQPPFDQLLVRKAFIASVDRRGLIAHCQGIRAVWEVALTLTPPGVLGHVDGLIEGVGIDYNPAQAQAWLAEAGFPNGKGLPPIAIWFPSWSWIRAVAEYTKQQWMDNLGVTVDLRGVTSSEEEWLHELASGTCQVSRVPWGMDYPDAYNSLFTMLGSTDSEVRMALGGWQNPAYDALEDQVRREPDPNQRKLLYRQVEKILVEEDAMMMPLFYYGDLIAAKPYLTRTYPFWGAPNLGDWDLTSTSPL